MNIAKILRQHVGTVAEDLDVNAVLGEPRTVGDTTIVPVIEMLVGFGAGTNCCDGESCECGSSGNRDAGTGRRITRTIATIEVGPTGTRVQPVVDSRRIAMAASLLSLWVFGWLGVVLKTLLTQERD